MIPLASNLLAMVQPRVNNGASIVTGSAIVNHNAHTADHQLPPTITDDEYDKKHHLGKYADGSNNAED